MEAIGRFVVGIAAIGGMAYIVGGFAWAVLQCFINNNACCH